MYVLRMPHRYMSDNATAAEKRLYVYYKVLVERMNGWREGDDPLALVLPSERDPDTKMPLFDIINV